MFLPMLCTLSCFVRPLPVKALHTMGCEVSYVLSFAHDQNRASLHAVRVVDICEEPFNYLRELRSHSRSVQAPRHGKASSCIL